MNGRREGSIIVDGGQIKRAGEGVSGIHFWVAHDDGLAVQRFADGVVFADPGEYSVEEDRGLVDVIDEDSEHESCVQTQLPGGSGLDIQQVVPRHFEVDRRSVAHCHVRGESPVGQGARHADCETPAA